MYIPNIQLQIIYQRTWLKLSKFTKDLWISVYEMYDNLHSALAA